MNKEINQSKLSQIAKYGGIEGYRAEMRRRRLLHKKPTGFSIMSKEQLKQAQLNSAKARSINAKKNRAKKKQAAQNQDAVKEND